MTDDHRVDAIAHQFDIPGKFLSATQYGSGHINDTYCVIFDHAAGPTRYIVQRINQNVFKNAPAIMENIQRVTAHLAARYAGRPDRDRRVLTLIPARDGKVWHLDLNGDYWRAYRFIEGANTYESVTSTDQAFHVAKAYGDFQKMLIDLPGQRLHDAIPDFHNTPKRLTAFEQAVAADIAGRAIPVKQEIEFVLSHKYIIDTLLDADLPERIVHNDTKFNNVMVDDKTGEGICVIDLDTVMPGLTIHDFGDMVRTATSPVHEDEPDLSKVKMLFPMFEALVRGYLESTGSFLTNSEKEHLVFAGKLITYEQGIRFLTDYLSGDPYYKVHRVGHNLDRCRTQFKLIESLEQQEDRMHRLVRSLC